LAGETLSGKNLKKGGENMPKRIQRKRIKGWRMPENTVCVTRISKTNPGKWGNPFEVKEGRPASEAVGMYREALETGKLPYSIADVKRELAGKNLACWCKPGTPCHGDYLLEIANG
jgi:uncharacterized protein YvpB